MPSSIVFIPFGRLSADPPWYDTEDLHTLRNFLPILGGLRMVRKIPTIEGDTNWGTDAAWGAYSHLVTEERNENALKPEADRTDGSWLNEEGTNTDLYKSVDDDEPSVDDFIVSAGAPSGDVVELDLTDPPEGASGPATHTGHTIYVHYKVENSSGSWDVDVNLMQGSSSVFSDLSSTSVPQITGSADKDWETWSYTLNSTTEAPNITDYTDLRLRLNATIPGDGVEYLVPNGDVDTSGWKGQDDGKTSLYTYIDEGSPADDGTTYLISPRPAFERTTTARFELSTFPEGSLAVNGTWKLTARLKVPTGGGVDATVKLWQGEDVIATLTATGVAETWTTYSATLSASEVADIENAPLEVTVAATRTTAATGNHKLHCSAVWLEYPDQAAVKVAWLKFALPLDDNRVVSDECQVFAGSRTKLWKKEANGIGFDDVTRTSGNYAQGSDEALPWEFCSFGLNVVATNFVDAVQVKAPADTEFSDLITSTDKPQARYCATVNNHLVLGDVSYSGANPDGQAFEVWWSGVDAPETFDGAGDRSTGADRQALPEGGKVTGLTGGRDYGIIWKASSIYRMDYVGGDLVFWISRISNGLGTIYPKSIVPVGNDIYFFSGSSFAVLRGGQQVELLGRGVQSTFFDDQYGTSVISQGGTTDPARVANTIVGAFDQQTGLIWWMWRSNEDKSSYYQHLHGAVYNVFEDRWAMIELEDTDANSIKVNQLVGCLPALDLSTYSKGIYALTMQGGTPAKCALRFDDSEFYDSKIVTKYFSAKAFGIPPGHNFRVVGVRPIIRMEGGKLPIYPAEVVLSVVDNPYFEAGKIRNYTTYANEVTDDGWYPFAAINCEYVLATFRWINQNRDVLAIEGAEYKVIYEGQEGP